ncbi:MAG: PQQ-dependent sugar dehydrogenase, partial [Nitrososphaerales archaeon]
MLGIGITSVLIGYGLLKTKRWSWKTAVGISIFCITLGAAILVSLLFTTSLSKIIYLFELLFTTSLSKIIAPQLFSLGIKAGYVIAVAILISLMLKSARESFKIHFSSRTDRILTAIVVIIPICVALAIIGYNPATGVHNMINEDHMDTGLQPYVLNIQSQTVVKDLGDCGTSFVFLPDGRIFCAELKGGRVRVIENFQLFQEPLIELDVYYKIKEGGIYDERGLLGIAVDPNFESNHYVYLHWTYLDSDNQSYKQVARFVESHNKLTNMTVLLDKIPSNEWHNGGPLEFGYDGKLYITGGETWQQNTPVTERAQNMSSLAGKILRINSDGSIPSDNPFPNSPVYTMGHRNVFGIGFNPVTKVAYVTENGPESCDEVNVLSGGKNYGWPYATPKGCSSPEHRSVFKSIETLLLGREFVEPLLEFRTTVAPTELVFYTGDKYPYERNNMFFLSYVNGELYRVEKPISNKIRSINTYDIQFEGTEIAGPGGNLYNGLLDIEQGPDGYLYVSSFDRIMRLDFSYSNVTTVLSLFVRANEEEQESVKLTAKISDYLGNPLTNLPVEFFDSKTLIGSTRSNLEGIAQLEYTLDDENHSAITAKFVGNEKYKASSGRLGENEWSIAAHMPTPRDESRAASIGNKIYVVGGFNVTFNTVNTVEIYDVTTNKWSNGKELPIPLDHVGIASHDGKLYVVGGYKNGWIPSSTLFIYDPPANKWTQGRNMPTARGALTAEFIDGTLYAVGGFNAKALTVNEAYDPATDTWTTKASMPTPREHLASGVVDGKLYVIGGRQENMLSNVNANEEYDPKEDKWTIKAPMPTSRGGLTAISLSNSIYVL